MYLRLSILDFGFAILDCGPQIQNRQSKIQNGLGLFLLHLQRQLRVHIPAVVAGAVGQLGAAALGAPDEMDRGQRVMRPTPTLAGFADLLYRLHVPNSNGSRAKQCSARSNSRHSKPNPHKKQRRA
jgi:hypothetical protein